MSTRTSRLTRSALGHATYALAPGDRVGDNGSPVPADENPMIATKLRIQLLALLATCLIATVGLAQNRGEAESQPAVDRELFSDGSGGGDEVQERAAPNPRVATEANEVRQGDGPHSVGEGHESGDSSGGSQNGTGGN